MNDYRLNYETSVKDLNQIEEIKHDKNKFNRMVEDLFELSCIDSRFIPVAILGKGKSGTTYKVYSPELNKYLALKIINDKFNPREAELMARLKDIDDPENLVQIYDAGMQIAKTYHFCKYAIVMEYIDGINLHTFIANPRSIYDNLEKIVVDYFIQDHPESIPSIDAVQLKKLIQEKNIIEGKSKLFLFYHITSQILNGIISLRKHGITHRDLHPKNIKINNELVVKILDFGIATDEENPMQVDARRYGSPVDKPVDDLFSLGLLLFEMYNGYHLIAPKTKNIGSSTHAARIAEYKQKLLDEDGEISHDYHHLLHGEIGMLVQYCLRGDPIMKIEEKFIELNPNIKYYFMRKAELIDELAHHKAWLDEARAELQELKEILGGS
ncbi:protein kinase [Candidatus Woesearchaeota archaeon]|nr:protein kinase [Candidatus Woesearchaeota archaeon]